MMNEKLKKELKAPSTKVFGEPGEAIKIIGTKKFKGVKK